MSEGDILKCIQQYGVTKHQKARSIPPLRSGIQSQEIRQFLLRKENTHIASRILKTKVVFMDNENHKNTWNNFTKFVLWGTVAVIFVLVLMALFLLLSLIHI